MMRTVSNHVITILLLASTINCSGKIDSPLFTCMKIKDAAQRNACRQDKTRNYQTKKHAEKAYVKTQAKQDPLITANLLVRAGKIRDAIHAYRDIADKDPENVLVLYRLGILLSDTGSHRESLAYLDQVVKLEPNLVKAHYYRAIILGRLNNKTEMIVAFQKVVELEPDNVEANFQLGVALHDAGKREVAKPYLEKVVEHWEKIQNKNPDALGDDTDAYKEAKTLLSSMD